MADRMRPAMSVAEREVLKALWAHGPSTVREVQELLGGQGQEWTRSTVITLLQRLEKKRYVTSDKSGFAFIFRPAVTREDVARQRLAEVASELYEGDPAPLVLAFAERHQFTEEEIEQLRRMFDEMEAKRTRRKKS